MNTSHASRRTVLAAAGSASLTTSLVGCGGSDDGNGSTGSPGAGEGSRGDSEQPGDALTQTSEVPRGGGAILEPEKVVVTQPSAGEFRAYSAVCQHQGCLVTSVSEGTINCACHGSKYDIEDGSVVQGPATRGLPEVEITVQHGRVSRA